MANITNETSLTDYTKTIIAVIPPPKFYMPSIILDWRLLIYCLIRITTSLSVVNRYR